MNEALFISRIPVFLMQKQCAKCLCAIAYKLPIFYTVLISGFSVPAVDTLCA